MTTYKIQENNTLRDATEQEQLEFEADRISFLLLQEELAKTQYQRDRAKEYPPMADYIDGMVKGDTVQMQRYIDACLAIKAKYPKPN